MPSAMKTKKGNDCTQKKKEKAKSVGKTKVRKPRAIRS